MCGRFTLFLEPDLLQEELELGDIPAEYQARYNIAPSQPVAVVTDGGQRQVEFFRWGLIPSWAKDAAIGNRMINARSETLADKPAFRTAFARRRCLILANGFFEWHRPAEKRAGASQPYFIHLASGKAFAFAGLWEAWRPPAGEELRSCTIITCAANELVGRIHDRMPVILDGEKLWRWLDPSTPSSELQALLRPYPSAAMAMQPISSLVNSPANDHPQIVQPVD